MYIEITQPSSVFSDHAIRFAVRIFTRLGS